MQYDCLIIDDEEMLANSTKEYFNLFGVKTEAVFSLKECLSFLEEHQPQVALLDINLKDGSGFELCKIIRKTTNIPILFISARSSDDDKIIALNIGGDDYVQKPYSLSVLLAKVKAVLKRYGQPMTTIYQDKRLYVNTLKKELMINQIPVQLKALEFKLLAYLVENRNQLISKQELFENVWKDKFTGDGTLNVHIRRIREVIELDPNHPTYIITIWKEGYRFEGETQ